MVVGNQARMGESERFQVSEYHVCGDLSKIIVIWLEIRDKGDNLVLALISVIGSSIGSGEW